jgi:hypothetical protein
MSGHKIVGKARRRVSYIPPRYAAWMVCACGHTYYISGVKKRDAFPQAYKVWQASHTVL